MTDAKPTVPPEPADEPVSAPVEGITVSDRAKAARSHRFTQRVTLALGVVVIALAAVFFVTTTNNSFLIMNQVEAVKDGPYPVSVAAGRIETL